MGKGTVGFIGIIAIGILYYQQTLLRRDLKRCMTYLSPEEQDLIRASSHDHNNRSSSNGYRTGSYGYQAE